MYTFALTLFLKLAKIFSLFSQNLRNNFNIRKNPPDLSKVAGKPYIWFHSASVGEYEQVRALGLEIRKIWPQILQVFSVYSYSGWSQRKNDSHPDIFTVLPFDLPHKIKPILNHPPAMMIYARYDVWYNLAKALFLRSIPQYVICAALPENSKRSTGLASRFNIKIYSMMKQIFTVDPTQTQVFENQGLKAITAGDTRFEAILERQNSISVEKQMLKSKLKEYLKKVNKPILIAGSSYLTSEKMLLSALSKTRDFFLILAPHRIHLDHLSQIQTLAQEQSLVLQNFSEIENANSDADVLLLDVMGLLIYIYDLADLAYIGGAFEGKIHNILEPCAAGLPVLAGPHYKNSPEAVDLSQKKLFFSIPEPDAGLFINQLQPLLDSEYRKHVSQSIDTWFHSRLGATEKIITYIQDDLTKIANAETSQNVF